LQKPDDQQCPLDPCAYIQRAGDSVILLAIHVDDLIIVSND